MSLVDLLRDKNYNSAQEAYTAITTPVEIFNFKAWTVNDLIPLFLNDINTILGTLKAVPVFESAFIALSISGLELASENRQKLIDQIATVGQWSDELKIAVKRLGRPLEAPWQSAGLPEPTLADVEIAFETIQKELEKEAIRTRLDAAFNQIGTTEQQQAIITLREIATELEG